MPLLLLSLLVLSFETPFMVNMDQPLIGESDSVTDDTLSDDGLSDDVDVAQAEGLGVGGIGLVISHREGRLMVIAVIEDYPADEEGLSAGQEVIAVDGVRVLGLSLGEAADMIQGTEGTEVELLVKLPEGGSRIVLVSRVVIPEIEGLPGPITF